MSWKLGLALGSAALFLAGAAQAQTVSDRLELRVNGVLATQAVLFEGGENINVPIGLAADVILGLPSVFVVEPDGTLSDVIGTCASCAPDNQAGIAFSSDFDTLNGAPFVPPEGATVVTETGPINVSQFLSANLRANGWTATFIPDVEGGLPEPATWSLMILGVGMTGARLRRRRPLTAIA